MFSGSDLTEPQDFVNIPPYPILFFIREKTDTVSVIALVSDVSDIDGRDLRDLARFSRRIDKRQTKRIELRKIPKTVRLTKKAWEIVDRNREPMGMSISQFIQYCVVKTTEKYEKERRRWFREEMKRRERL